MLVEPRTWEFGPTHTMASGNEVCRIVKCGCDGEPNGKAIPCLGGRLGRLPRPASCWATVVATATQIGVGSPLTTSVRCCVADLSAKLALLEQPAKAMAPTPTSTTARRTAQRPSGSPGTPSSRWTPRLFG